MSGSDRRRAAADGSEYLVGGKRVSTECVSGERGSGERVSGERRKA
eukprot:CAMPEP_0180114782 /NCGR_PEP_ID=MMETSP0985-20121206/37511_1 /TAXON_ID=483367 /ORGANISM="non described non described, Strain CCMP 2436" /LENGTH=45 /DNA_ID= /DNA_START= /DNA_END= /DNA_ORIENTATION=